MDTQVRTPSQIFSGPQHLDVPVFQRRYVWDAEAQWEPLWRDIERVAAAHLAGTPIQHFLGAIVTQGAPPQLGGVQAHALVDGQQRLTTLQIMIDAAAAELEAADRTFPAQQLNALTYNLSEAGSEPSAALKLRHQNDDHEVFVAVMTAEPPIDYSALPSGLIRDAHRYFAERVHEYIGNPVDPSRASAMVSTLTQGVQLVVISLTAQEPSQEIFETLNARGTPLTAADLIKNFVFQQINAEGGDSIEAYRKHWAALESKFWEKQISIGRYRMQRLSLFLNHWLVAHLAEEVSTKATFSRFKTWFEDSGRTMRDVLSSLHRQATLYEQWSIGAARKEGDLSQVSLFVYRTEAADIEAVKPLLLWLYDVDANVPAAAADAALRDIEGWVMRRALLRRETSGYSRTVVSIIKDVQGNIDIAAAVRTTLRGFGRPSTYWPGDREVTETLTTSPVYQQPKARVRAYLEAVEDYQRGCTTRSPRSETRVKRNSLSIEHLLPQQWPTSWAVSNLAQEEDRRAHVHVLGNLTLLTQTLNSRVSNGPWSGDGGKRAALRASDTLLLTREVRDEGTWDENGIDARTARMTEALVKTWAAPTDHDPTPTTRADQERTPEISVRMLVAAGALDVGTLLHGRISTEPEHIATITASGELDVRGTTYESPSGAAKAAIGRGNRNGWSFWRLSDGTRLSQVRDHFAARAARGTPPNLWLWRTFGGASGEQDSVSQ